MALTSAKSKRTKRSFKSLGAYSNLKQLIALKTPAKNIRLVKNRKAFKHLTGPYNSTSRGRGMEFEDIRQYQAGDDIRLIDWRVTARLGQTHTKQFREEKEIPVLLLLDLRHNMFFGSKTCMKSVLACDLFALLAWSALANGDRVGGFIFNDDTDVEFRPKQQRKTVLQLLDKACMFNQALKLKKHTKRPLHDVLLQTKRLIKPGFQVFLISDCHDLDEQALKLLHNISEHSELVMFHIYDALEKSLPAMGDIRIFNGQDEHQLPSSSTQWRKQYQNEFDEFCASMQKKLGPLNVPFISVATDDEPLDVLKQYFKAQAS